MEQVILGCASRCKASLAPTTVRVNINRHFSTSKCHQRTGKYYFIKKAPNFYEASRVDRRNRTDVQRILNIGFKKIPFDSKFPVTAKHTGPQVPGGSYEAARLTAIHGNEPV